MDEKFRSLREIAAKASPELKRRIAGHVLVDSMHGRRVSSIGSLYGAALRHFAETSNPVERRDAERMLRDLKKRMRSRPPAELDPVIYEIGSSLTDKAREQLAELSMVAALASEGGMALLEAAAVLLASKAANPSDREHAVFLLNILGPEDSIEMFKVLRGLGFVTMENADLFLEIRKEAAEELERGPEARPHQEHGIRAPSVAPPLAQEQDEIVLEVAQMYIEDEDISSLEEFAAQENDFAKELCLAITEKGLQERLKFPEEAIPEEDEPSELSADLGAVALRDASLRGREIPNSIMYRLICVKCFGFGLGSSSAFVGSSAADVSTLQSNLLKKVMGDRKLRRQVLRCWKSMEQANAIIISDSSKTSGKSASLNAKPSEISDQEVSNAVEWAIQQNRSFA